MWIMKLLARILYALLNSNFQCVCSCQENSVTHFLFHSTIRQAMIKTVLFGMVHSAQQLSKNKTILCRSWLHLTLWLLRNGSASCAHCMLITHLLWDAVTDRTSSQHLLLFTTGNPQGRSGLIFLEFQVGRNTLIKGKYFTQAMF